MNIGLLALSLLLVSNTTIVSSLEAHQQKEDRITVDTGKSKIEVVADDGADLTCKFSHLDQIISTQTHTEYCVITVDTELPAHIMVSVYNNSNHTIVYSTFESTVK